MRSKFFQVALFGVLIGGVGVSPAQANNGAAERVLRSIDTRANRALVKTDKPLVLASHSRRLNDPRAPGDRYIVERLSLTNKGVVADRYFAYRARSQGSPGYVDRTEIRTPGRFIHNIGVFERDGLSLNEFVAGIHSRVSEHVGKAFNLDPAKAAARVERYRKKYAPTGGSGERNPS